MMKEFIHKHCREQWQYTLVAWCIAKDITEIEVRKGTFGRQWNLLWPTPDRSLGNPVYHVITVTRLSNTEAKGRASTRELFRLTGYAFRFTGNGRDWLSHLDWSCGPVELITRLNDLHDHLVALTAHDLIPIRPPR